MGSSRSVIVLTLMCFGGFLTASSARGQQTDSLPQLTPTDYVPSTLEGFQRTSQSGLSEIDRTVMTGVQSGAKAYWVTPNLPPRLAAFDVSTDVYRFDTPAHARRSVQEDFKKMVGTFGRDTVAGLPVVTAENRASLTADYSLGYQQGTLGIRVLATQSVTSGSASISEVKEAARRAFRAVVEEARSNQ